MEEKYTKMQYCPNCLANGKIRNYLLSNSGKKIEMARDVINNGFIDLNVKIDKCIVCDNPTKETKLTIDEWRKIKNVSTDPEFVFAMEKLKKTDIIEFNLKLSQMQPAKTGTSFNEQSDSSADSKPKCPTCQSTDIKRISGTKRWLGTGIFGLASSDIGKTMQCNKCGYKW